MEPYKKGHGFLYIILEHGNVGTWEHGNMGTWEHGRGEHGNLEHGRGGDSCSLHCIGQCMIFQ
jgi:hypothetical protein